MWIICNLSYGALCSKAGECVQTPCLSFGPFGALDKGAEPEHPGMAGQAAFTEECIIEKLQM